MMLLDGPEALSMSQDMPVEDVISAIQRGHHPAACQGLVEELTTASTICDACKHPTLIPGISNRLDAVEGVPRISYHDASQFEDQEVVENLQLLHGT
jgi:hypothetical protein